MGDLVQYEKKGAVGWLRLNRPTAMNSLNEDVIADLEDALDELASDADVRVGVITGTGPAFCCGADLKAVAPSGEIDAEVMLAFVKRASAALERIPASAKPIIAAVNGMALAGGMELALACDVVIAAQSAVLGDAHANFGLLPGAGGAARMARLAGPSRTMLLALTGDLVPAESLIASGVVNEVVPDDQLEERVNAIAATMAAKSPLVLAKLKRLVLDGLDQPLAAALQLEHEALAEHVHSEDIREGLAAFRQKRTPQWTGR